MTHVCVGKLTIIGSDNGLLPGRRQTIIWINPAILLIGPFGTNFSDILIEIQTFSFKKIHLKMSFAKWRPFLSRPQWVKSCNSALIQEMIRGWRSIMMADCYSKCISMKSYWRKLIWKYLLLNYGHSVMFEKLQVIPSLGNGVDLHTTRLIFKPLNFSTMFTWTFLWAVIS